MTFVAKTAALVKKDLRTELRGRDTLPPMLVFAFVVSLLLAFTLPGSHDLSGRIGVAGAKLGDVLAGFMWVTVLFAGLIGFGRTFEVEREDGGLDALLLVPLDRSGLFAAKAVANLLFIAAIEVPLIPLFALLFGIALGTVWPLLLLVVFLVDVGFAALGTLFASLAAQTRSRELILPILALPALVPIFIAAVELTSQLFTGGDLRAISGDGWFGILVAFDVIFTVVGALTFEFAVD